MTNPTISKRRNDLKVPSENQRALSFVAKSNRGFGLDILACRILLVQLRDQRIYISGRLSADESFADICGDLSIHKRSIPQ